MNKKQRDKLIEDGEKMKEEFKNEMKVIDENIEKLKDQPLKKKQ